jgi:hypothetical protein
MTRKLLLTLFSVIVCLGTLLAQMSQNVNVSQPGTLSQLLGENKTKVTDLTLTGTINDQDFQTFKEMTSLKVLDMSKVDIVDQVIPSSAFIGRVMDRIILPEGLREIQSNAFRYANLTQILVLPSSLEKIGNNAFQETVVSDIDFSQCRASLTTMSAQVFFKSPLKQIDLSLHKNLKNFESIAGFGTFCTYSGHVILPDNLEVLPSLTFARFAGSVDLPAGLKDIRSNAFRYANLTQVLVLPSSLEKIGNNAFQETVVSDIDFSQCRASLTTMSAQVFFKSPLKQIDLSLHKNLKNFESIAGFGTFCTYSGHVILPDNLEVLPSLTFARFAGSVDLPAGLKDIRSNAFRYANLTQVLVLPSSLEKIGNNAFQETVVSDIDFSQCRASLTTMSAQVFFKSPLKQIDLSLHKNLKNFESIAGFGTFCTYSGHVILPDNLEVLPSLTFARFAGSVDLPAGLKSIGNNCFLHSTIKEITLPENLTSIGTNAFYNCSQLVEIVSNNSIPPILGTNVFYNVNKSTCKLIVPNQKAVELYSTADQWKDFLPEFKVPSKINLVYQEQRGSQVLSADYQAVRVGEYYWMNNNFNAPAYRAEKLSDGSYIYEGDYDYEYRNLYNNGGGALELYFYRPNNKEEINKGFIDWESFPAGQLDFWSYGVTLDEFNKYVGDYCTPSRIDYMKNNGSMLENGQKVSNWSIPYDDDLRQLVAMCGYGMRSHEVIQYLTYSAKEEHAPALAKITKGSYWIYDHNPVNLDPNRTDLLPAYTYDASHSNKYGMNLVSNGSRKEFYDREWVSSGWLTLGPGNYKQLGQAVKIHGYNATVQLTEEMNVSYKTWGDNPLRPTEWNTVRWCRPLTDEELGYKLYINRPNFKGGQLWGGNISDEELLLKSIGRTRELHAELTMKEIIDNYANIDIVKLGVNQPAPQGYSELPKGLLRGYYVQFMIERPESGKTLTDILEIAALNKRAWYNQSYNNGVDLVPAIRTAAVFDENQDLSDIRIYPNPVENVLNINASHPIDQLELYNTTGSLVLKQTAVNGSIDVSNLSSGVYILKLQSGNSVQTHKILKK